MCFTFYLELKYATACEMLNDIPEDKGMIAICQLNHQFSKRDAVFVYTWMRNYGLFQGIARNDRNAIVECFLEFIRRHPRLPHLDDSAIRAVYIELFAALYQVLPRTWLSATSKLLWCIYPDNIVIYDAFVHRALTVMQSIDPVLVDSPRIGNPPVVGDGNDIEAAADYYMRYQAMVRRLFEFHGQHMAGLRVQHNEQYPHDIRIVDKLLWMIGNSEI